MIFVLGLLAKAGHGKTNAANYLRDTYGAKIVSLAGPLKRCAQKVMRFSQEQLFGTQAQKEAIDPRYGMSARMFLQKLGTEGLREEFGEDVHIRALLAWMERQDTVSEDHCVYVVDDVRFVNEVEALALTDSFHGAVIKIVCTDAPGGAGDHASESSIDSVPDELLAATVISSRALGVEDLRQKLEAAIHKSPKLATIVRQMDRNRQAAACFVEQTPVTTKTHP
jgi:dephospho-CoA kinase